MPVVRPRPSGPLVMLAGGFWLLAAPGVSAEVSTGIDAEAQLPYWELVEPGISIRLVQRLPDQTRGFFQARGFSVADSDLIAQNCVFQTVFRNPTSAAQPATIEYSLRDWTVHAGGAKSRLKTREDWQPIWTARAVSREAQLAFEWGLLPTRQTYAPGDYNWGMTLFGLAPGTKFDLDVVWRQRGERRVLHLSGVQCAPEAPHQPAAP